MEARGSEDLSQLFLPEEVGRDDVLARVDGLVDWVALEAVCGEVYATLLGRPSYPLRLLIKALFGSGVVESFGSEGGAASLERSALSVLPRHWADGKDSGPEHALAL